MLNKFQSGSGMTATTAASPYGEANMPPCPPSSVTSRLSEADQILAEIQNNVGRVHALLFGPQPTDDCCDKAQVLTIGQVQNTQLNRMRGVNSMLYDIINELGL